VEDLCISIVLRRQFLRRQLLHRQLCVVATRRLSRCRRSGAHQTPVQPGTTIPRGVHEVRPFRAKRMTFTARDGQVAVALFVPITRSCTVFNVLRARIALMFPVQS
jgi:hypothetical protein